MQYRRLVGRSMSRRGRTAAQNRPVPALFSETLEDRTLLTTYLVDTTVDESDGNFGPGDLSLREAMELSEANAGADEIRFAPGLNNAVFNITLGALPVITDDLQIIGTIGKAQTINGQGLVVNANGAGDVATLAINSVNVNKSAVGAGVTINATSDGVANVTIFNSRLTNSATQGLKFVAHTGGIVNLRLSVVTVLSNGDVTPSEGILGEVGIGANAQSPTVPANFATANLDFSTLRVSAQALEGLKLNVATGGQVTTPNTIRNSAFNDNGVGNQRSGVKFEVDDAGSSLQANFENSVSNRATGMGFEFRATDGANLDVGMTGGSAVLAKSDAMNFFIDGAGTTATADVDGFNGSQAIGNGLEVQLSNGATAEFTNFNNANLNTSGKTGLMVSTLSGSTLSAFNSTGLTSSNTGENGMVLTTLASESHFNFTNTTTNDNVIRGVQIGLNAGSQNSTANFNNLTATGNKQQQAMSVGLANSSELDLMVDGGTLSTATATVANNVIHAPIMSGSTANLTFNNVNMNNSSSSGIVARFDGAQGSLNLTGTTSTGNKAVGVAVFAVNGGDVDANFTNVNVSNAGTGATPANGIRLEMQGVGATGDFTFNGVTASNASGQGISLFYNGGASGSVAQFNNVTANNTGGDGVNVQVRGANSQLTSFNASGVTVNTAGKGTASGADGFDLSVLGPGAMANVNLQNLSANSAGGRGLKIDVQNTSTLDLGVDTFSASNNRFEGVKLDIGTVVGGSTLTGGVFANGSANGNGTAPVQNLSGIRTTVMNANTSATLMFDNVSANSNRAEGFDFTTDSGASLDVELGSNVSAIGNAFGGIDFVGIGPTTTVSLTTTGTDNQFRGNSSYGIRVFLGDGVTADDITLQGEVATNQENGIIISDDASGVTINNLQVRGDSQINNNTLGGLVIDLDGALGLSSLDLSALTINGNGDDQINVNLKNMSLMDLSLADVVAIGTGSGDGDGIELTLDNTMITNSLGLNRITATDNGGDGLQFNFLNGSMTPATGGIDVGTFDDNGQHGIYLNVNGSTAVLDLTNTTADSEGTVSSASGNGGNGLNVELNDAIFSMPSVDRQTFSENDGSGINILGATPSDFISGNSFTNNEISNNGSFGFHAIFNGGTFDISIGSRTTADQGNILDSNVGAGISIDMIQNAEGRLAILDNEITNTSDGTGAFNGDGIFIRQLGTANPAQATNLLTDGANPGLLIRGNRIGVDSEGMEAENDGFGITFDSRQNSAIDGLHILNNEISNNGMGGIEFLRRDTVGVTDFIIGANMIEDNLGNGIGIFANNSALAGTMFVTIGQDLDADGIARTNVANWLNTLDGNIISGNTNGIHLHAVTDSQINVTMRENQIYGNSNHGILTTEESLSEDSRRINGNWDQNIISNNTNRGISFNSGTSGLTVSNSFVGAVLDQFGQVIAGMDGNGSTGIELNSFGSFDINDSDIIRNGILTQDDRSQGHGIDIQNAGFKNVQVRRTQIFENFQDGVEILFGETFEFDLEFIDTRVVSNVGRGYDVLKRGEGALDSALSLVIRGTNDPRVNPVNALAQVASNGEEGIYIVNTPSTTQNQTDFSYVALAQDGPVNTSPRTNAQVHNVLISSNGNDIGETGNRLRPAGSGLVVRVGSSDNSTSSTDSGGFANGGRGGVVMTVHSNFVTGNVGDGMFFHGYRATAQPAAAGGTWSDTDFALDTYQSDPLARFDLTWGVGGQNNVFAGGDELNANNDSQLAPLSGTPDGQAGAFYQSDDATFKSRSDDTGTNAMTAGPFDNTNRRRNAQRQAFRGALDPTVGSSMTGGAASLAFLYPGMGASTFRVRATSGNNADLPISGGNGGFNTFGGTDFTPTVDFGELPFAWGTF